jgi:hypothetical protein
MIEVTGQTPHPQPVLNCQNKMKPYTNENGKLEYKASFVVTQIVIPKDKYRQLITMVNFQDNKQFGQ